MSSRILFMGELALDIALGAGGEARYSVDDPLVNAAASTASFVPTAFIGEASADLTGNLIVSFLDRAGVDLTGVDRITEGQSPVFLHGDEGEKPMCYVAEPKEGFNPVWPRINPGDVMVWGSYFSLDKRVHPMMTDILRYARARKAFTLYVPYFDSVRVSRVTRVMPEIFDNLELADGVLATRATMAAIFGETDMDRVYRNNINFYTSRFRCFDAEAGEIITYDGDHRSATPATGGFAAAIASVASGLCGENSSVSMR